MASATSLNVVVKNGDGCAFIQWSAVQNATIYQIGIKNENEWTPSLCQTTATCFFKMDLENQQNYMVQVTAINKDEAIETSTYLKIKPRSHLSVFNFVSRRTENPGRIRLKWTDIPTNTGYQIERCDIGLSNKYISVVTIKDNKISTFEDQTSCDPTNLYCAGHHYKISAPDAPWLKAGSQLSAKIFCMRQPTLHNSVSPQAPNMSVPNSSVVSTAALSSPSTAVSTTVLPSLPPAATTTVTATTRTNDSSLFKRLFGKHTTTTSSEENNSKTDPNVTDHINALPPQISSSHVTAKSSPPIKVCKGDLITQQTDVIVVCPSSTYLFETICKAGGDSLKASFNAEMNKSPEAPVVAVKAAGQLSSKMVYFLRWEIKSDALLLSKSIQKFVSDAMEKAATDKYQNIAFPAIGCGKIGCSISLVAQAMIEEAYRQAQKHGISILFVIQPERTDIYDEFQKQINLSQQPSQSVERVKPISTAVNKGIIEVEQGDITAQKVDVIIGSSSSEFLKKAIMKAAGNEVETAYNTEYKNNSNAILISTPPGILTCKRIFFIKWQPSTDEAMLRQSLVDLIWTVIQNMIAHKFISLAFPAIGCGKHGCSVDIVVKTLVKEVKNQLIMRNLPLKVKFIIQSDQQNIYDEFCKQVLTTSDANIQQSINYQLPATWEKSKENKMRFELPNTSDEYKSILTNFDQAMKAKYTKIIRIERIQNERWFIQYLAHGQNFKTRLNTDTEKTLYHGCPEHAVKSIMEDCFNRSFAGVNGTLYGVGVYFSSDAAYSHGYAIPNANGERSMFLARVLVGNTTQGNSSMKTRPVGFDSTTDGKHIFVTYHDAQAYAEYLITYK